MVGIRAESVARRHGAQFAGEIALIAVAYYVSGRLGLLLAIPPGYATAVFPPAGLALAAILLWGQRALPGVWLGSFLMNAATSVHVGAAGFSPLLLVLPAMIGAGATLQAGVGATLIQRLVGYRNLLEQELEVVWILALGGPLACLIGATVGVGSLWLRGLIPDENLLFNWWTWWVGDSIGVLIFTPLLLVWAIGHNPIWRRRQLYVTMPLAVMFGLVVMLFVHISQREAERIQSEFEGWGDDFSVSLRRDFDKYLDALQATNGLYTVDPSADRPAFDQFTGRLLERGPGLQALSWSPLIGESERGAFEASMRAQGYAGYRIGELDALGRRIDAGSRRFYAPVAYIEPLASNRPAIGFDLASESRRAAMLTRARTTGKPAASAPIRLLQEPSDRFGLLIAMPVFGTPAAGGDGLRGYTAAVLRVPDLMQEALRRIEAQGVIVRLSDRGDGGESTLIYGDPAYDPKPASLQRTLSLNVAGRTWTIELSLPAQFFVTHRSLQAWTLLAAGMLFTGLLGVFLLVVIGRTARIEELVAERTVELTLANDNLAIEAQRSARFEAEARRQADRLAESNAELERFAYIASHDLQAPLRSVASFTGLVERRYRGKLDSDADEFLDAIRDSVKEMRTLIDDLLQLSRVTGEHADTGIVDLREVFTWAQRQCAADIAATGTEIRCGELPTVPGDVRLLRQLFQNLLGNAVRFHAPGAAPQIDVAAEREGREWRIAITDNGIGIPENGRDDIFLMFKRLHTSEQYPGTGMGLAICRKVVQIHGGRIWAEAGPDGRGTRFVFTLPAETRADEA